MTDPYGRMVVPVNAPQGSALVIGVQPGTSPGIVYAQSVIISGTGSTGVFVYSGTPGNGNPPIAWMTNSTADPFGNTVTSGFGTTKGSFTGTNFVLNSTGFFLYSGTPANGNLAVAIATAAGSDSFGNAYSQGITVNKGAIDGGQINAASITGGKIAATTITAGNIVSGTITATQIATGTITAALMAAGIIVAGIVDTTTLRSSTIRGTDFIINTQGAFFYQSGVPIEFWDFQSGTLSSGTANNWRANSPNSVAISTAWAPAGQTYSLKLTAGTGVANPWQAASALGGNGTPCSAGQVVNASAQVNVGQNATCLIKVAFYNGTTLLSTPTGSSVACTAGTPAMLYITGATAPANTTNYIVIVAVTNALVAGNFIYITPVATAGPLIAAITSAQLGTADPVAGITTLAGLSLFAQAIGTGVYLYLNDSSTSPGGVTNGTNSLTVASEVDTGGFSAANITLNSAASPNVQVTGKLDPLNGLAVTGGSTTDTLTVTSTSALQGTATMADGSTWPTTGPVLAKGIGLEFQGATSGTATFTPTATGSGLNLSGQLNMTALPINLENITAPAAPANGVKVYGINGVAAMVDQAGLTGNLSSAQLSDVGGHTVTAAALTTITTAWSIPASDAVVGSVYELTAAGHGTQGSTQETLEFAVLLNAGVPYHFTIANTFAPISGGFNWRLTLRFTIVTTGSGGTYVSTLDGIVGPGGTATATPVIAGNSAAAAFNTTIANTVALQAAWGSTTGTPTITCDTNYFKRVA